MSKITTGKSRISKGNLNQPLLRFSKHEEMSKWMGKPHFKKASQLMKTARRMYALPIPRDCGYAPLGYDSIVEVDGEQYFWPNQEAFVALVKAKHYLVESSYQRVCNWLTKELEDMKYDTSFIRKYNPERGIAPSTLLRIMKYNRPRDECLLSIDEREELFRHEVEGYCPSLSAIREGQTREPNF